VQRPDCVLRTVLGHSIPSCHEGNSNPINCRSGGQHSSAKYFALNVLQPTDRSSHGHRMTATLHIRICDAASDHQELDPRRRRSLD
jgi:hypothetical protein